MGRWLGVWRCGVLQVSQWLHKALHHATSRPATLRLLPLLSVSSSVSRLGQFEPRWMHSKSKRIQPAPSLRDETLILSSDTVRGDLKLLGLHSACFDTLGFPVFEALGFPVVEALGFSVVEALGFLVSESSGSSSASPFAVGARARRCRAVPQRALPAVVRCLEVPLERLFEPSHDSSQYFLIGPNRSPSSKE